MKLLCLHAHFDDFEFVASGLYTIWRSKLGAKLQPKVVICTDGRAGHHFRTREATGRMRLQEQENSARVGNYLFEPLRLANGEMPREACLQLTAPLLAALWKSIRDFQPDYLFAPPVPNDPLAGIHIDHVAVAEAVRKVAYMINVPHAFTPEYPADETQSVPCKVPVILTLHDAYMAGENAFDLAIDVEDAFEQIAKMAWAHQSQIVEWIPWVGRHAMDVPTSYDHWREILRQRFVNRNREMGIPSERVHEFFTVTAWGEIPSLAQITQDFPNISPYSNLDRLGARLKRWRGE